MDRCPDCHYAMSIHFRGGTGERAGEFLGCPRLILAGLGIAETYPRVSLRRVITRGTPDRKGHLLATWADYQDGGLVLYWDLDTGEQWMGDLEAMRYITRKLSIEEARQAKERLEDIVGGPVRIVTAIRKRRDQNAKNE